MGLIDYEGDLDDFSKTLEQEPFFMMKFTAPWCKECQRSIHFIQYNHPNY
jgi:hypothetical protein